MPENSPYLRDLIWRKYHELANLPLPSEDANESLDVLSDTPGSPLGASLGIPMAKRAREILAKQLKGYIDVENTLKPILYRFQMESSPGREQFRRGGEYYYAGKPSQQISTDYHYPTGGSEGGSVLKVVPTELKNPMISVNPTTYKGAISALGGKNFFEETERLVRKIYMEAFPFKKHIKAYSRLTGATPKEIMLAHSAIDPKNSLLDLAKKKLLQRAGLDAIVRARKQIPEVFVTNPGALQDLGKYFVSRDIPQYLPD